MNIMTIVVLAVLAAAAWSGLKKGMVKKLAGIVALLASSFLVSFALPYITEFLKSQTPVYQYITDQCENVITDRIMKEAFPDQEVNVGSVNASSLNRDQIKALMDQYGLDGSRIDNMSDAQVQEYVEQYFQEYLDRVSGQNSQVSAAIPSLTKVEQTKLIQNLPIPSFLKETMLNYNNSEGYRKLEVDGFIDYIVRFFGNVILNIVAFIVTLVAVQIVLWTGLMALDVFARLPVINLINRAGGLVVGLIQGLFIVWILFLVISVFSGTEWGMALMDMVNDSVVLKPVYNSNLFMQIVVQAISNIM